MNLSPQERKGERSRRTHSSSPGVGRSVVQLYSRLAGCALSAMPLRRMGFLPPSFLYLLSRGPFLPSSLLSRWRKERGRRGKVDLAVKVSLSLSLSLPVFTRRRKRGTLTTVHQRCCCTSVFADVHPPSSSSSSVDMPPPLSPFLPFLLDLPREEKKRRAGKKGEGSSLPFQAKFSPLLLSPFRQAAKARSLLAK